MTPRRCFICTSTFPPARGDRTVGLLADTSSVNSFPGYGWSVLLMLSRHMPLSNCSTAVGGALGLDLAGQHLILLLAAGTPGL